MTEHVKSNTAPAPAPPTRDTETRRNMSTMLRALVGTPVNPTPVGPKSVHPGFSERRTRRMAGRVNREGEKPRAKAGKAWPHPFAMPPREHRGGGPANAEYAITRAARTARRAAARDARIAAKAVARGMRNHEGTGATKP